MVRVAPFVLNHGVHPILAEVCTLGMLSIILYNTGQGLHRLSATSDEDQTTAAYSASPVTRWRHSSPSEIPMHATDRASCSRQDTMVVYVDQKRGRYGVNYNILGLSDRPYEEHKDQQSTRTS